MKMESSKSIVVGIDGGGSHVSTVAILGDEIIFRGNGGPGNPLTTDQATLVESYTDALSGCPSPHRAGACVAGAGSMVGHDCLTRILTDLLPDTSLAVGADYLAALHVASGHDIWVVAGTGSVVASLNSREVVTSGGRGWLLGDRGSAARLGRVLIETYVEDPDVDVTLAAEVDAVAGTREWLRIARHVQSDSCPAAWLGQFAPVLTARAESGESWARRLVEAEMSALASTTARHARRHLTEKNGPLSVCLVGGVWRSSLTLEAFTVKLQQLLGTVEFARPDIDEAVGAARFAEDSSL
jgi:glucosamine kinase